MIAIAASPPVERGGWEDSDRLRRWSFARRTPEQRLNWLVEMLDIAYQTGAIKPRPVPAENAVEPPDASPINNL